MNRITHHCTSHLSPIRSNTNTVKKTVHLLPPTQPPPWVGDKFRKGIRFD
jgi:hypothetical protein